MEVITVVKGILLLVRYCLQKPASMMNIKYIFANECEYLTSLPKNAFRTVQTLINLLISSVIHLKWKMSHKSLKKMRKVTQQIFLIQQILFWCPFWCLSQDKSTK